MLLPWARIAPPLLVVVPPVSVRPVRFNVLPLLTTNSCVVPPPLIVTLCAPTVASIVRLLLTVSVLVSVITVLVVLVQSCAKVIVSPDNAAANTTGRLPDPLLLQFVTVSVPARTTLAGGTSANAASNSAKPRPSTPNRMNRRAVSIPAAIRMIVPPNANEPHLYDY